MGLVDDVRGAIGGQGGSSNMVKAKPVPRPTDAPKRIPRWAYALFAWQGSHEGARPETPKPLPGWYLDWKTWWERPFQLVG